DKKAAGPAGALKAAAKQKSSAWAFQGKEIADWEKTIKRSEVLGVFAGHFHSADRAVYGVASEKNPLAVRESVAGKTWVAPPLSIKFQYAKPDQIGAQDNPATRTARGFLIATVAGNGAVSVTPRWYVTLDAKLADDGDIPLAQAKAEENDEQWGKAVD